jgi:hypothetical protein
MSNHLVDSAVLAVEFPHISDYRWEFLSEGPGVDLLSEMAREGDGALRIYDLGFDTPAREGEELTTAAGSRERAKRLTVPSS